MREIKFRAWDTRENKMIPDFTNYAGWEAWDGWNVWRDNKYIKLQYTGLKDATKWDQLTKEEQQVWIDKGNTAEQWRGKEIHEGDIVKIQLEADDPTIHSVRYWDDHDYPAFDLEPQIDCDSNGLSYAMAVCEITVIGNIYERSDK